MGLLAILLFITVGVESSTCKDYEPATDCMAALANGRWSADTHEWELCPGNPCRLVGTKGLTTLESLRGTLLLFVGDSMLRQVFHGFIHSHIRGMPVVVDPVYGSARYTAVLPPRNGRLSGAAGAAPADPLAFIASGSRGGEGSAVRDSLQAKAKGRPKTEWGLVGSSPLQGWDPSQGVEMVFEFLNTCPVAVNWLHALAGVVENRIATNLAQGGEGGHNSGGTPKRRVVVVTNVGASNVKASLEQLWCFAEDLPEVGNRLANLWSLPPWFRNKGNHVVVMSQPLEHSILEMRLDPRNAKIAHRAVERGMRKSKANSIGFTAAAAWDAKEGEGERERGKASSSSAAAATVSSMTTTAGNAAWSEEAMLELQSKGNPLIATAEFREKVAIETAQRVKKLIASRTFEIAEAELDRREAAEYERLKSAKERGEARQTARRNEHSRDAEHVQKRKASLLLLPPSEAALAFLNMSRKQWVKAAALERQKERSSRRGGKESRILLGPPQQRVRRRVLSAEVRDKHKRLHFGLSSSSSSSSSPSASSSGGGGGGVGGGPKGGGGREGRNGLDRESGWIKPFHNASFYASLVWAASNDDPPPSSPLVTPRRWPQPKFALTASLLDFAGLVRASSDDPLAPPDVSRPTIEDKLHYGCQWGFFSSLESMVPGSSSSSSPPQSPPQSWSPPEGFALKVGTKAGRPPAIVKGMRVVNRAAAASGTGDEATDATTGLFPPSHKKLQALLPSHAQHCALACKGAIFNTLSTMLLTLIHDHDHGDHFLPDNAVRPGSYVVDACEPDYDEIPCPLYPAPAEAIAAAATPASSSAAGAATSLVDPWERGSASQRKRPQRSSSSSSSSSYAEEEEEEATKEMQDNRLVVAQMFQVREETLLKHFRANQTTSGIVAAFGAGEDKKLPDLDGSPVVTDFVRGAKSGGMAGMWAAWVEEFERGGYGNCRNFASSQKSTVSHRLVQAAPAASWCAPALEGPGGTKFDLPKPRSPSSPHHEEGGQSLVLAQPLGVWCSLPVEGHFEVGGGS